MTTRARSLFSAFSVMSPRRLATMLIAVLLSSSTVGCAKDPTSPFWASARLSGAEARWKKAKLTNYSFISAVSCFCLEDYARPLRVTVRQGRVTAVFDVRTGAARPVSYRQPMDSIFAMVRLEIVERPERLNVSYDEALGFPRTLTYGTPENDGGGTITIDSVLTIP